MKHIFIVNPISGHGRSKKNVPIIERVCQRNNLDYEIIFSDYAGHSKEIAKRYTKKDDVCLYAVGGDGTAYEVLNSLNDGVTMAVIPSGSGNDFFANLVQGKYELEKVIEDTINGENIKVDYATTNGLRFMNTISVGYCAEVNYQFNVNYRHIKLIPSKMVYVVIAVALMFKPKKTKVKLIIDSQEYNEECILLAVQNGIRYGGGFTPTPMAVINDGLLNLCMIDFVGPFQILKLIPVYFQGKHVNLPITKMFTGSEVKIILEEPLYFQIDGEIIQEKELTITLQKSALDLRVPADTAKRLGK